MLLKAVSTTSPGRDPNPEIQIFDLTRLDLAKPDRGNQLGRSVAPIRLRSIARAA
jgi:hypothetical protein